MAGLVEGIGIPQELPIIGILAQIGQKHNL